MRKYMILPAVLALFQSALMLAAGGTAVSGELSAVRDSIPEGYELVDSVIYVRSALVDTSLAGKNIFRSMPMRLMGAPADVKVHQSLQISTAMNSHFISNASKVIEGYRVRIFFDNRQSARADSDMAIRRFESAYPGIAAYRSYVNPYFKVTVGDFRTKSEAMQLLQQIKTEFPAAFIVKENINYPIVDRNDSYRIDTLRVLRPVRPEEETFVL